jgi:hypothetical protein
MEINEAIKILKDHNEWRKGGVSLMVNPSELSNAIDTVVNFVENNINEVDEFYCGRDRVFGDVKCCKQCTICKEEYENEI